MLSAASLDIPVIADNKSNPILKYLPTSRKKHYLCFDIDSQWQLDNAFIPSFIDHIGHRVRDVFLPNTRRIGSFCVQSALTADKLCDSFNSGNYSCRGRKPKAQKLIVSSTIFCIKLSNVNHTITTQKFQEWIHSLHAQAFDIKLQPVEIFDAPKQCILSFDSIETAISIKQQSVTFCGVDIRFSHWYVPRKTIAYPDPTSSSDNVSNSKSQ